MRWPICRVFVLLVLTSPWVPAGEALPPHPVASPGQFELHPTLSLSLFAQEPDVVDPVALTFDEFGRVYVVEMRDYPYGIGPDHRPGGTVRLLEDTDGDGRADKSILFADSLSFPTSIAPWNGGVLVAAPPDILFLKDTDGDGKADVREVILTGFRLGVTDSNLNGLRWGLDNWVHGANGGNGGEITSPKRPSVAPVKLGDRDFRFDPMTGEIELTSHTGGGFGLVFDDWGHSFVPHNINHLKQRVADVDCFTRFPGLPAIETTLSISDHGDMARIYPISRAQTRPNHPEQAGHFSSAGGMGFMGHRGWPGDLPGSVFVCDVVGNLVHRDLLVSEGPILKATRAPGEQTREFFASRDSTFRPTGLELGPDGALYLLDMQRDVIEHPDYIPKKLLDKLEIRAGADRGRIYRILPKDRTLLPRSLKDAGTADPKNPEREPLPGQATPEECVRLLKSPNLWTRQTVQRLLVGRKELRVTAQLKSAALDLGAPRTALHALWILDGLKTLDEATVLRALAAPSPELRECALLLAESRLRASTALQDKVSLLLNDAAPAVRFRAALNLGLFRPLRVDRLVAYLGENYNDPWLRRAGLAASGLESRAVLRRLLRMPSFTNVPAPSKLELVRELAGLPNPSTDDSKRRPLSALLVSNTEGGLHWQWKVALIEGLTDELHRHPEGTQYGLADDLFFRQLEEGAELPLLTAAWRLAQELGLPETPRLRKTRFRAMKDAQDPDQTLEKRLQSIQLLGIGNFDEALTVLFALMETTQPSALQQAAFAVLRERKAPAVASGLVENWRRLAPSLRPAVVNLLVFRRNFQDVLLSALEHGRIQIGELNLDLEQRRALLRNARDDIRERASRWMSDDEYSNRAVIVDQWLAKLPETGDAARGRPVFEKVCAQCHRAYDLGNTVGPDLTAINHRSVEDLLSNILDPNMAMNPEFVAYTVELTDGEEETGILSSDNPGGVTLLQAQGHKVEIPRFKLKRLYSNGRSLMPEGLEAGMSPQDLRDLIAFIQQPLPAKGEGGGTP